MAAAAMEAVDRVQQELMMTTAATTIMVRLTSAVLLSFRIHSTYCGGNRALWLSRTVCRLSCLSVVQVAVCYSGPVHLSHLLSQTVSAGP